MRARNSCRLRWSNRRRGESKFPHKNQNTATVGFHRGSFLIDRINRLIYSSKKIYNLELYFRYLSVGWPDLFAIVRTYTYTHGQCVSLGCTSIWFSILRYTNHYSYNFYTISIS
jgi:hypothetical protein